MRAAMGEPMIIGGAPGLTETQWFRQIDRMKDNR